MPGRVPYAVVVLPYAVELEGGVTYAVFRATTGEDRTWGALCADGGRRVAPLEAARWTAWHTAGIPRDAIYLPLDSRATIELDDAPCGISEHAFAVRVCADEIRPAPDLEHRWVTYQRADAMLSCEGQRTALWELRRRLGHAARCG